MNQIKIFKCMHDFLDFYFLKESIKFSVYITQSKASIMLTLRIKGMLFFMIQILSSGELWNLNTLPPLSTPTPSNQMNQSSSDGSENSQSMMNGKVMFDCVLSLPPVTSGPMGDYVKLLPTSMSFHGQCYL